MQYSMKKNELPSQFKEPNDNILEYILQVFLQPFIYTNIFIHMHIYLKYVCDLTLQYKCLLFLILYNALIHMSVSILQIY